MTTNRVALFKVPFCLIKAEKMIDHSSIFISLTMEKETAHVSMLGMESLKARELQKTQETKIRLTKL